jgi:copper transport protein
VSGHALLRSSQPAAGATLGSGPPSVTLSFSEPPDLRLTSVRVLDRSGGDHVAGPLEALADPADSVRAPIGELGDGVYTVSWRTVSSVDGHVSAGSFVFGVGVAPPTGSPDQPTGGASQSGSPPGIVARWTLYLGLVGLIGAAFVALAVAGRRAPDLLAVAALGWVLTAAGTVGVVAVQWIETGAPLEALPSTSVGLAAFARAAALALVGLAIVALAVVPRLTGRAGWAAVGVTSALALGIDVMTGHAAAGAAWLQQVTVQWTHGLGAAAWVGGLAALLVLLRSTPAGDRLATARRFSRWAGIALVVVALTGVVRAVGEIGTLEALIDTDFGRVVLVKTALLLGLAGLGAVNRYVTFRDAARVLTGLRRIGGLEVMLAVAVLGFSALLVNLTPPTSAGGPVEPIARPIVATGSDFGTSVRVRLIASPGAAGGNDFDLAVVDYDSGEPVDAAAAELRFELVSQAGVAPSSLSLERAAPGRYRATGANLSIDGIWRLTATIAAAGGAVEVPLLAAMTVPPQPVERLVSPDLPTISTIQLGATGSAQVYLDPGGEGPNELHVTFFDPVGMALPVETVTIAAFPEGGGAELLAPRLLQPGHFVAAMGAVAGELAVDVVGPVPGGGQVHLHVTIEVEP